MFCFNLVATKVLEYSFRENNFGVSQVIESTVRDAYFWVSQVIGMTIISLITLQPNEMHHSPHISPPLPLLTKSANWSIGVFRSHPMQWALPMAPLVHPHRLQHSVITSPPRHTSPTSSPASLGFIGFSQLPSPYSKADAPRVALVPLHPSNYCSTADCRARHQFPSLIHTSRPSRLSFHHHPSRLHQPISDYSGIFIVEVPFDATLSILHHNCLLEDFRLAL